MDSGPVPIITLEILSETVHHEIKKEEIPDSDILTEIITDDKQTGIHFLSEKINGEEIPLPEIPEPPSNDIDGKDKVDLLEYLMRNDGSVVCKLCGEILLSRTHWYRHKYKVHVLNPCAPTPLFQCEQCLVYFKSRKGYIGHIASRHSEMLADSTPVISNQQVEQFTQIEPPNLEPADQTDSEQFIPKSIVPNYNATIRYKNSDKSTTDISKRSPRGARGSTEQNISEEEWLEKRSREKKLITDIIDRVRRECEAQGIGDAPARRGYSRRPTVINS